MRTRILIFAAALLLFGPVSGVELLSVATSAAQSANGDRIQQMAARLNLTPRQKELARPIITASIAERRAILQKHGIRKGQRPGLRKLLKVRSDLNEARTRTHYELARIFSPAQMDEYRKLSDEIREEFRQKYFK